MCCRIKAGPVSGDNPSDEHADNLSENFTLDGMQPASFHAARLGSGRVM